VDHLPAGLIDGFDRQRITGHQGVTLDVLVGGSGPPLLLLHGYPQTRMAFKQIAPALAEDFTVVIPDLRGYGRSDKPDHLGTEAYAKRTMALDQIAVMAALGFDRFSLAGHDRGGRVAYRLALDHPGVVDRLVLLDILPMVVMWERANATSALRGYHWYFMAQPAPLPEHMIGLDPEYYLRWKLRGWSADGFDFDPESLNDYLACGSDPPSIHGACEDYRAGWLFDGQHDEDDRQGRRTITAPTLLLWGADYSLAKTDPIAVWDPWVDKLEGYAVPGGHFLCEEAPEEVLRRLQAFLTP